ncbi:MAG: flavodoxin family protein [Nitrospinae bacterium]|nr:flavodoxin family protein [Nitrospinota bacterium]
MSKTALIINGTTRINGNTDILVEKIIEGSIKTNVDVRLIELRKKNITNCIGCYRCLKESRCSFQDDMTEIREEIYRANLIILASPLYWCGVTGLMKTFIDRLFFYYHPQNRGLISGKKATIVTPMNQRDVAHESEVLVEFYRRLLNCLGVKIVAMFFFSDIMDKGAVLDKPEYLKQAYTIGSNLSTWIENGDYTKGNK